MVVATVYTGRKCAPNNKLCAGNDGENNNNNDDDADDANKDKPSSSYVVLVIVGPLTSAACRDLVTSRSFSPKSW